MLVATKELLRIAEAENKAVGAFNVTGIATLQAVIEAAEELNEPVIIEFATAHEEAGVMTLDFIGPLMVAVAKNAKVPVAVHLDHGVEIQYVEKALKMGFTSIMYDGSALPYEENVANTIMAVKLARQYGASVEAEIGKMAGHTLNNDGVLENRAVERKDFTDPKQAKDFVQKTNVDCLACSFGTSHGLYTSAPKLDIELIKELHEAIQIPIVMHGGSGVSNEDYGKAIDAGVKKVNYYSYMAKAGGEKVREEMPQDGAVFFHDLATIAMKAMKENAKEAITLFKNKDKKVTK